MRTSANRPCVNITRMVRILGLMALLLHLAIFLITGATFMSARPVIGISPLQGTGMKELANLILNRYVGPSQIQVMMPEANGDVALTDGGGWCFH
jgi:hypothetical protein